MFAVQAMSLCPLLDTISSIFISLFTSTLMAFEVFFTVIVDHMLYKLRTYLFTYLLTMLNLSMIMIMPGK